LKIIIVWPFQKLFDNLNTAIKTVNPEIASEQMLSYTA